MDFFAVTLLLIVIVLLVNYSNNLNKKLGKLEQSILELQGLINKSQIPTSPVKAEKDQKHVNSPGVTPAVTQVPEAPESIPVKEVEIIEFHKEVISDVKPGIIHSTIKTSYTHQKIKEPKLSFFERYPDLEKFIGENLINKIGIAILVLAIGFFVKYAIDNNWVGPAGRVGIGVLCGGILVAIAHRMRIIYKAFSSVLVGGGMAIFYFTITLAYHEFHLFGQTASFIILIVITCFAVALSLLYDKQELAVIALVGGMSSPFMVSNGSANYNALFTYLLVLNAGLLIIAYNKAWRILNISAFGLTILVLGGIIYTLPAGAYSVSFVYITALYLMFFAINIAYNIREKRAFMASDFTILLVNTALYFSSGLYLLTMMHAELFRGLFSASLGALNLIISYILFKTKRAEINILYLLIGITLTFISLTAPIQLHGHFITLFWAAETVLLYWLYQKSGIKLMQTTSVIIWVAMIVSLILDWTDIYYSSANILAVIVNKGFITTICTAISCWLLYLLSLKPNQNKALLSSGVYKYLAVGLLFLSGALEINHQFLNRYPLTNLNILYLTLYLSVFVYVFSKLVTYIAIAKLNWEVLTGIYATTTIVYLLLTPAFFDLQSDILEGHKVNATHFIAHWIGAAFMLLIFYELIITCKNNMQAYIKPVSWALSAAIVLFFSLEVCLISTMLFFVKGRSIDNLQTLYIKTGLPILWGVASFALMWLGMRYKTRVLRIISLTLFTLTLVKLFVYDIKNIPPAGKIAAFFCLGVLLLIISFMYQKVKTIITDDGETSKN